MADSTVDDASVTGTPVRTRRRHRIWKAVPVLAILLVIVDIGLRLVFGLGNPVLYQADPDCGYLPVASQHVRRFFANNDINRFGMRSADVADRPAAGVLRVFFLGDSVSYGTTYVDQSAIFTSILARQLPAQLGRPVDVLNESTGAWAPGNEVGYLRSRGTFGAQDVIFVLNNGDLTQPFNGNNALGPATGYPVREPFCALSELWTRYLKPRINHVVIADKGSTAPAIIDPTRDTPPVLASLSEADSICRRNGAHMAIVMIPGRGAAWENPQWAAPRAMLDAWAQSHHVPIVDVGPALAVPALSEVYQPGGIHLTARGNDVVAHEIERRWPELVDQSQ